MEDNIDLVKRCQNNDNKAFDDLYKKYSPLIYGICLRYLKDKEESKDIMQDCFIKILEKIKKYHLQGSFEGWLRRLTINTIIDYIKKKNKLFATQIYDNTVVETIEEDAEVIEILQQMSAERILNLINLLAPRSKIIFNLYAVEGIKGAEIAKLLEIEESTVRSIYKKAKDNLIKKMKEENYGIF